jgi:hypothetical protein
MSGGKNNTCGVHKLGEMFGSFFMCLQSLDVADRNLFAKEMP